MGVPRTLAVLGVIVMLILIIIVLLLVLIPLVQEEGIQLAERAPDALDALNKQLLPWLREHFGIRLYLNADSVQKFIKDNITGMQDFGLHLLTSLKIGGLALIGIVNTLLLTPVALFFLLRDWNRLIKRVDNAIPRDWHAKTTRLLRDADAALSEFLRGQLLVMLAEAVYYSIALALAGLPSALPVGVLTGLLVFVPYLGFGLGIGLALMVAGLQMEGFGPVLAVLFIYGLGQVIETVLLTPYLVGERIGLHPLTVLFALMAFGQLFGFVGVLIALPVSATLLVGLREVRRLYLSSRFYRGDGPDIETDS